jgi:hypothetical protein
MEVANCRYCGELGFWGKAHTKCMAIAGEGRREIRAAIHAALTDDFSMGAIRRIVGDIAVRARIPQRDARELVVEEYLRAMDRLAEGDAASADLEDKLDELRRQFQLSRFECMRTAA